MTCDVITHPDKILFPDDGITKGDLAAYYEAVASVMLPHLRGRPLTLERFPNGIGQEGFIQKNVSRGFPEWLQRIEAPKAGGVVHYAAADDARSLQWIVNQNTVTLHVWPSRLPRLSNPDWCVIDLDPTRDDPERLCDVMATLRTIVHDMGHRSWVKTSGSKGYHVVLPTGPRATFSTASRLAGRIAARLAEQRPDDVTLEFRKADRGERIYIDTARNRKGATVAAAYSVRARTGAPVSAPCTWEEIASGAMRPQSVTLRSMADRLAVVGDLWSDLV